MISRRNVYLYEALDCANESVRSASTIFSRKLSLLLFFYTIQRTLAFTADADHTRRGKCIVSSLYFERKYYRNAARASALANTLYLYVPLPRLYHVLARGSPARNNIWPRAIARVVVKIAIPRDRVQVHKRPAAPLTTALDPATIPFFFPPRRFHSFVVYLVKSAPDRLSRMPRGNCRPRNATIIGIKGASVRSL